MSDGPYRSLNMRRGWKTVAEFADNEASASDDICGAVGPAISSDWQKDVPPAVSEGVCEILGPTHNSLFSDDKGQRLEALRPLAEPGGLGHLLIDCAAKAASDGRTGESAPINATVDALTIWGARHVRQIEEHYHRKCVTPRAESVRGRTEQGVLGAVGETLARQLLGISDSLAPRKAPKQTGLDDGVKL